MSNQIDESINKEPVVAEPREKLSREFFDFSTQVPEDLTDILFVTGSAVADCGYGHTTRAIYIQDRITGKTYDDRKSKALYINGFYRDTISRYYSVIPDQRLEAIMKPLMKTHNLQQFGTKEKTSNGLGTCWKLLSDKTFEIKRGSGIAGDVYGVCIVVKNSVNGGIALSANVSVLRQVCSNGMMGWRPDMALKTAHYGNVEIKLEEFSERFDKILTRYEEIEDVLQNTIGIDMTRELAQFFVTDTQLPKYWLPDWIHTDEKYRVTGIGGGTHSLYDAINDVTYKLTRSAKGHPEHNQVKGELGFQTRNQFERQLGRSIEIIVQAKGNPAASKRKR